MARLVLLAVVIVYTLVVLGLLVRFTRIDAPAVAKGRIPHMFAFIGGWEILIGANIAMLGDGISAIGPIMMGIMFIVGSFTWTRVRRRLNS